MNGLDEIKERLKEYKHFVNEEDALIGNVGCNLMFGDIEFLLQRLEKYEKSLNQLTMAERDYTLSCVERIAKEALKDEIT